MTRFLAGLDKLLGYVVKLGYVAIIFSLVFFAVECIIS